MGVVGFSHSKKDHGDSEVDRTRDEGRDPFGPAKGVVGFLLFEVEVDLLEDILGLEGDHPGFMLKLADGGLELRLGDVLQDAFSVPPPVENLGLGSGQHGGFFSINLMILKSDIATG